MKTDNLQNCEHHVLICVKSKHGCESGMMSWTYVVEIFISICKLPNKKKVIRRRLIV